MPSVIGEIAALYRYPVKSMRGEQLESATLGWHGIETVTRTGQLVVGQTITLRPVSSTE